MKSAPGTRRPGCFLFHTLVLPHSGLCSGSFCPDPRVALGGHVCSLIGSAALELHSVQVPAVIAETTLTLTLTRASVLPQVRVRLCIWVEHHGGPPRAQSNPPGSAPASCSLPTAPRTSGLREARPRGRMRSCLSWESA